MYCLRVIDMNNTGVQGEVHDALIGSNSPILYIGKAETQTLNKRLRQELLGKSNGTFFRSLGAVLGYLPPKGSMRNKSNKCNYKFSEADKLHIKEWMDKYLEINWIEFDRDIHKIEKELISTYNPILNIKDNPKKILKVVELRKKCREYASN